MTQETDTLIDRMLAEQRSLTAVSHFSRWHRECDLSSRVTPYRSLIPLEAPKSGQQYAFEVDLDKCSGCKACVTACHALNGLEDDECWRSVGLLISQAKPEPARANRKSTAALSPLPPFQQHVTTACHHCIDPACLNGCPVLTYEKDPVTGIVHHLDDQCIGCQYCVMKCPYDVPKYSERLGIVRKCDLCSARLAEREAPACVQACPNAAIQITVIDQNDAIINLRLTESHPNDFLPGTVNPAYTVPTTRYASGKVFPKDMVAADDQEIRVQPSHFPLVWMLVLTQCAVGIYTALPFAGTSARPLLAGIGLVAAGLGICGSFLHLGRPLKGWRVFLGLRRSWLSREIVMASTFMGLAGLLTCHFVLRYNFRESSLALMMTLASVTGLFAVLCSGMVYHDTRRDFWQGELSIGKFSATTICLGLVVAWFASQITASKVEWLPRVLILISVIRLAREFALLRRCPDDADLSLRLPSSILGRSAMLMRFRLGLLLRVRVAAGWIGGVVLPAISLLLVEVQPWLAALSMVLCLTGEFAERVLFFRAVVPRKMPGGLAA